MRGDQKEPLWADSLADQPRPDYDVIVRVLEEEPEDEAPPPPPREPREPPGPRRILAALGLLLVVAVLIAREGDGALTIADVPSGWGDVPMSCDTVRLERDERAVEHFTCRAIGGRPLPAGTYRSPESQWTSDISRRDADSSHVKISKDGEVVGWATYDDTGD